jgi:palmitoyl-protein thioesterase
MRSFLTALPGLLALLNAHRSSASPVFATANDVDDTPLPVLLWHGLGDSFGGEAVQFLAEMIEETFPGTLVYPISVAGSDANADRDASIRGKLNEQFEVVCAELAAHPILSTAPAVDAVGFSQGGLFLRALVERCNVPKVRTLLTLGSPHNGIADFHICDETQFWCKALTGLVKSNTWGDFAQNTFVPLQYYRTSDPEDLSRGSEEYLEHSAFLADINNERAEKNESYAKNLASIEHMTMLMWEDDTVLVPKESAWWADFEPESKNVTKLQDRPIYKEDWLGLKALDAKGALEFRSAKGPHMDLDGASDVIKEVIKGHFGPERKSKKSGSGQRVMNWEF